LNREKFPVLRESPAAAAEAEQERRLPHPARA
jgi:hypothetical protein